MKAIGSILGDNHLPYWEYSKDQGSGTLADLEGYREPYKPKIDPLNFDRLGLLNNRSIQLIVQYGEKALDEIHGNKTPEIRQWETIANEFVYAIAKRISDELRYGDMYTWLHHKYWGRCNFRSIYNPDLEPFNRFLDKDGDWSFILPGYYEWRENHTGVAHQRELYFYKFIRVGGADWQDNRTIVNNGKKPPRNFVRVLPKVVFLYENKHPLGIYAELETNGHPEDQDVNSLRSRRLFIFAQQSDDISTVIQPREPTLPTKSPFPK